MKLPPVLVAFATVAVMWLIDRYATALDFHFPGRRAAGSVLAGAGILVIALAVAGFRRAHTTVNPVHPERSTTLVVSGVYTYSRNPMYLGLLLGLVAVALWLGDGFALLLLPAFVIYFNRFQIAREEAALAARFGPDFIAYRARVRRWI